MRTTDFRQTGWGHNHYFEPQDDGTYFGPCWTPGSIKPGDQLLWKTNYGHAEAVVLEVKYMRDPPDMSFVRSQVVGRVADPAIVSQEELDKAFT